MMTRVSEGMVVSKVAWVWSGVMSTSTEQVEFVKCCDLKKKKEIENR